MSGPTDISIDLETVGSKFNAGILSIGAVAFNRHTGAIGPEFYASVKLVDTLCYGKVDAGTLQWWLKQGAAAAKVFNDPKAMSLYEALRGLNDFIRARPANAPLWGNGSSFDITILEHGFYALGVEGFVPEWAHVDKPTFWKIRDLRTLVDLAGLDKASLAFNGVAHNALDDARHQAKIAIAGFAKVAGKSAPIATKEEEW